MSFLDSLAGYAPYVAPIIEKHRQQDLQALMLKQQNDRQASQDKLAAALGQSTISHNAATSDEANARADSLRNPVPKPPPRDPVADARAKWDYEIQNPKPTAQVPHNPIMGSPEWKDAQKYIASLRPTPEGPAPQIISATGPANPDGTPGAPKYFRVPKQGGPATEIEGITPKPAAGAGGAQSGQTMQTMARLGTSYNDLKQAIEQMDAYENMPGNLANQTISKQMLGSASEMHSSQDSHGLMSGLGNAAASGISAFAQNKLGKDDPEYRTYLNNKQRVATAFTELLPRPNQQLLQLEKGLSGADIGWNPQLIKNIQGRRRGGLDVLKNILSQQGMLDEQGNMTGKKAGANVPRGISTTSSGQPQVSEEVWAAKNPPKAGETFEQYHARFLSGAP